MHGPERLAEIKPKDPSRDGQPFPKTFRRQRQARQGLVFLIPDRHPPKSQGQNKIRHGPQHILPRDAPALPGRARQQKEGQHDRRSFGQQRQHESRQGTGQPERPAGRTEGSRFVAKVQP